MTHVEMVLNNVRPANMQTPRCDGEMRCSGIMSEGSHGNERGDVKMSTELWVCTRCNYTVVIKEVRSVSRRITCGFPAPSIPNLKLTGDPSREPAQQSEAGVAR